LNILVTGGTGYIGSHTCAHLLAEGHQVTVLDNLCNSSPQVLARLQALSGRQVPFVHGDLRDTGLLRTVLGSATFDAVIHFAGLKAVGESVSDPLTYYDNNVTGTLSLLRAMQDTGVKTLVFSSSATVYGDSVVQPVHEALPLAPANPYGNTKHIIETILADTQRSGTHWRIACLRYFNPVGAHASGLIGEDPDTPPNNLMPYIGQVACGRREWLPVFGADYPTPDGTGVRDYIHVMDLAEGHLAALKHLWQATQDTSVAVNLGTGRGSSVLELVRAFETASGRRVPYRIVARRPGDVACCYADVGLSQQLLHWQARRSVAEMCADTWRWLERNPQGYREPAAS